MKVGGTAAYRTETNRRCTRGGSLKFVQTERVVTCSALERTARKKTTKEKKRITKQQTSRKGEG